MRWRKYSSAFSVRFLNFRKISSIQVEWPRCSINRPQAGLFTDNFCDIFGCVVHEISILDWPRVHSFLKKTRYFGCSDVDCNFVSTHALWQAVFILKSSKSRILNYSCRHHLMWIGCKRNSQFGKVPLRQASWPSLPYSTEGTWRELNFFRTFLYILSGEKFHQTSVSYGTEGTWRQLGGNLERGTFPV